MSEDLNFGEAAPARGIISSCLVLLATLAVGLYAADRNPEAAELASIRLGDPYGGNAWPAKTTIEVFEPLEQCQRMAKREPFDLRFRVRGLIPDRALVTFQDEGGHAVEQAYSFSRSDQAAGESTQHVRLESDRVEHSFRYRVRVNDADTGWRHVLVSSPPGLSPRDGRPSPQIHLDFPLYTRLASVDLPDGGSVVEAVTGTRVSIRAAVDHPVACARLIPRPVPAHLPLAGFLACTGFNQALPSMASLCLSEPLWQQIPVTLSQDGQRLDIDFVPTFSAAYVLRLEDEAGIGSERIFDIRLTPDPSPAAILINANHQEALGYTPTATFQLSGVVTDEKFGLREASIEYLTGPMQSFRQIRLVDSICLESIAANLFALANPLLKLNVGRLPPLHVCTLNQSFRIAEFHHPDGSPLVEGDALTLRISANDFDNVTYNKAPGRSESITLSILSAKGIEEQIQQALLLLRPEFSSMLVLQTDAQRQLSESIGSLLPTGKLTQTTKEQMQHVLSLQQQLRAKVSVSDGPVLSRIRQLRQAVADNHLPRTATTRLLEAVAADLDRLAQDELSAVENSLELAIKDQSASDSLRKSSQHQSEALAIIQRLLDRLQADAASVAIRTEARTLLNELHRRLAAINRLVRPGMADRIGNAPSDLSEVQRQQLDQETEAIERLASRTETLLDTLDRAVDEKQTLLKAEPAENNAKAALQNETAKLRKASEHANSRNLRRQLHELSSKIKNNRLGETSPGVQEVVADFQAVVDILSARPEKEDDDRLQKKRKETSVHLRQIIDEQAGLNKRIAQSLQVGNEDVRGNELRQRGIEQEKLRQDAQDLSQQLHRKDTATPLQELSQAAAAMKEVQDKLGRGQAPDSAVEEVLEHLKTAKEQLEKEESRGQAELAQEKTADVLDSLKSVRERQSAAIDEEKRLYARLTQNQKWESTTARNNLPALMEQQMIIAKEIRLVTTRQFTSQPVFVRMLQRSAEAMDSVVQSLQERKEEALDQLEGAREFDDKLETARIVRSWHGSNVR